MRYLPILLIPFMVSCAALRYSPSETLPGTWKADKYRVKIQTLNGLDKDSVTIISEEDFKEELGFDKSYARYNKNGSYEEVYWSGFRQDSLVLKVTGTWSTSNDSLIIFQDKPLERKMTFELKTKKNKAIFEGMTDWDNDGEEDDELTIVATKLVLEQWID